MPKISVHFMTHCMKFRLPPTFPSEHISLPLNEMEHFLPDKLNSDVYTIYFQCLSVYYDCLKCLGLFHLLIKYILSLFYTQYIQEENINLFSLKEIRSLELNSNYFLFNHWLTLNAYWKPFFFLWIGHYY